MQIDHIKFEKIVSGLLDAKATLLVCNQYAHAHEDKELMKTIEGAIAAINLALHFPHKKSESEDAEQHFCSEESTDLLHCRLQED